MPLGKLARKWLPEPAYLNLKRPWTAYARRRKAKRTVSSLNAKDDLLLVLQMGKVGSRTVLRTLEGADLGHPVFHLHHLARDQVLRHKRFSVEQGVVPVPYHFHVADEVRRFIEDRRPFCKIVTCVRDPIARKLSMVFQMPALLGAHNLLDEDGEIGMWGLLDRNQRSQARIDSDKALEFLSANFREHEAFEYAFEWFDLELKSVFGIDVFAHPFNRDGGWGIIRSERAEVLVVCVEQLSSLIPTVVSDFVGAKEPLREVRANVRSDRSGAEVYELVKRQLVLDKTTCEKIYASRLVRHFYTERTIDQWIDKWTRPRSKN